MNAKVILDITVAPKSSRNKISIDSTNTIKIYLTAPPVNGKANAELISLLSKTLKVPRTSITIIHGESAKKKRISIQGLESHLVIDILRSKR